jgi:probable Rubsico expression protein CbbX
VSGSGRQQAGNGKAGRPGREGGGRPGREGGRARREGGRGGPLSSDATVTFAAERDAAGIDDIVGQLDRELVGLAAVKKRVEEIAALLLVDRARQRYGLTAPRPNLHMCFTGAPGTGKTTVALKMAELLYRLGYLKSPTLIHAMRDDLVGEYIGQTAPKTKQVLDRARGGVLFIDEAYYLYRGADSKDYGQEAIEILLQVMENDRQDLVVILAGYKDRMDTFFESNPGMRSRLAHHLDFASYDLDELTAIGSLMLGATRYYLSPEAEAVLRAEVSRMMTEPHFANARTVRNELELARLRHAHRIASDLVREWTLDDLMRLEPADVLSADGDVFSGETAAGESPPAGETPPGENGDRARTPLGTRARPPCLVPRAALARREVLRQRVGDVLAPVQVAERGVVDAVVDEPRLLRDGRPVVDLHVRVLRRHLLERVVPRLHVLLGVRT